MTERKTYAERLCGLFYYFFVIGGFLYIADNLIGLGGYNATDSGRTRSGLSLYRDAETGCEYLSRWVGLAPRSAPDGKQMGCRPILPPHVP